MLFHNCLCCNKFSIGFDRWWQYPNCTVADSHYKFAFDVSFHCIFWRWISNIICLILQLLCAMRVDQCYVQHTLGFGDYLAHSPSLLWFWNAEWNFPKMISSLSLHCTEIGVRVLCWNDVRDVDLISKIVGFPWSNCKLAELCCLLIYLEGRKLRHCVIDVWCYLRNRTSRVVVLFSTYLFVGFQSRRIFIGSIYLETL